MTNNKTRFFASRIFFIIATLVGLISSEASVFQGIIRSYENRGCEEAKGAIKGIYTLGTIGPTCKAEKLGNSQRTNLHYPEFIVDETKIQLESKTRSNLTDKSEQYVADYGIRVANLIDQMSYDFLKKRELLESKERKSQPISKEELQSWMLFIKLIAYQESIFTHYQLDSTEGDENVRLRVMVGDQLFARKCLDQKYKGEEGEEIEKTTCKVKSKPTKVLDTKGRPIYRSKGMFQIMSSLDSELSRRNFDLVKNIENGMNHVYNHWARILEIAPIEGSLKRVYSRCHRLVHTKKGIDYSAAIRSAYGMYNGGDYSICRFADSDARNTKYEAENSGCGVDKIAFKNTRQKSLCTSRQMCGVNACPWVNDTRLKRIVKSKPWESRTRINDEARRTKYKNNNEEFEFSFDLKCMREGGRFCLKAKDPKTTLDQLLTDKLDNKLFTMDMTAVEKGRLEKSFCVYDKNINNFVCTTQEKMVPCLRNRQEFPLELIRKNKSVAKAYYTIYELPADEKTFKPIIIDNPQELCSGSIDGVFMPGQFVETKQELSLFKDKNLKSRNLGHIESDNVVQILDFDMNVETGLDRWYKVSILNKKNQSVEGFIYGGDDYDWQNYLQESAPPQTDISRKILPQTSDIVIVQKEYSLFEKIPDEQISIMFKNNIITPVAPGEKFKVLDVQIVGTDQIIYLHVENIITHNTGYIAAGQLNTNAISINASIENYIQIERFKY
ncbi:MAG: hypothetical protein A2Z20_10120 [Bdellovibrionales bacterium RBG_16_40_8]|nr:MAG: hypothetical protein A2Z20_10120 [Bdellovibrionales bacterium RBG_16_40_8]